MKKKRLIVAITLLLLGVYVGRVLYLNMNSKGFRVETEVHEINETFICNNFQYTALDFKILNNSQLKEEFDIDTDNDDNTMYLLAMVKTKYLGEESNKLTPIFGANFESGSWSNGLKSKLVNKINTEGMRFNPNEEKTLYIIAGVVPAQFSKLEWNRIKEKKYNIVLSTYPKKVEIKCY